MVGFNPIFRLVSTASLMETTAPLDAAAVAEAAHASFAAGSLAFVVMIAVCLFFDYTIKKHKFFYLPESAAAILFGTFIGLLLALFGSADVEKSFTFNPELFFFMLLPPIIFEAGYTLNQGSFFKNFGTILLYAVFGTLISTFIVGYGIFLLSKAGICPLSTENALESLMFGALISATDPVATLSLLGNPTVGAPPLLYALVFGEAVLNDAVAIVLYQTFESFLDVPFTPATGLQAVGKFTWVSIGSSSIGLGVALVCSFMFKQTDFRSMPHFEITLTLLFAFGSYFLAELSHLSGIMALFFCGVALAHYNTANISVVSRHATHDAFKSLAQVCEVFVFVYLGITIGLSVAGVNQSIRWSASLSIATIITQVLCLVARLFNTFPLSYLANSKRHSAIPMRLQICVWFAGLRGAIAFALSLKVPTANSAVIVTSTIVTVVFTTFIFGGMTEPFLRFMQVKGEPKPVSHEVKARVVRTPEQIVGRAAVLKARMSSVERFWASFDNMYMKYWFGGKIAEEYSIYREPTDAITANDHDLPEDESDVDEDDEAALAEAELTEKASHVQLVDQSVNRDNQGQFYGADEVPTPANAPMGPTSKGVFQPLRQELSSDIAVLNRVRVDASVLTR